MAGSFTRVGAVLLASNRASWSKGSSFTSPSCKPRGSRGTSLTQPACQLPLDVAHCFDAYRQTDQPIADSLPLLIGGTDVAMRGAGRVTARCYRIAQRRAEGNAARLVHELIDCRPAAR